MQFRDFRHQIEPNEETLSEALEAANYCFQDNLALLQLQQPELVQQLKAFELEHDTLCVSRDKELNILMSDTLTFAWPPRQFEADYSGVAERIAAKTANITALTLQDSGSNVLTTLKAHNAPLALIYVDSLLQLYASLHAHDWRSVLQEAQLIFQLGETIDNVERDLETLKHHGVDAKPCTVIQPLQRDIDAESAWHFEQALTWGHDCNPMLREHTHKFNKQNEFMLLNELIQELRSYPLSYMHPWSLILVGGSPVVIKAALQLPHLQRIIVVQTKQMPSRELVSLANNSDVELIHIGGAASSVPEKLFRFLSTLPKTQQLSLRLYQDESSVEATHVREMCELETRYLVQPTLSMARTYVAATHATMNTQNMLTRRSKWPKNNGTNAPALVVGNGPSLSQYLPALKQKSAQGYVIFSCGTAISTLLDAGITPHYQVELELNAKHLNDLRDAVYKQVTLIAPLGFRHDVRSLFKNHLSFIIDGHPLDELTPHLPDDVICVENAFPTVANLVSELLPTLGAKQLYFVGVDLAFQNEKHHAGGERYQNKNMEQYLHSAGGARLTQDVMGRPVYSKREFIFSAQQVRQTVKKNTSTQFYSLSRGLDLGATDIQQLPQHFGDFTPMIQPTTSCQLSWRKYGYDCDSSRYLQRFENFEAHSLEKKRAVLNEAIDTSAVTIPHALTDKQVGKYWSSNLVASIAGLLTEYVNNDIPIPPTLNARLTSLIQQALLYSSKI